MIYNELEYLKCIVNEIFGNCCSEVIEVILTYGNKLTLSQLLRLTNYNFRVLRNVLLHLIKHNIVEIQITHIQKGRDRECNHRNLISITNTLKAKKIKNNTGQELNDIIEERKKKTEEEEEEEKEKERETVKEEEEEEKERGENNDEYNETQNKLNKFMYGCKCQWCVCKIKKVQYSVCVQNIYILMRFPSIFYYMHPTNYEEKRKKHMMNDDEEDKRKNIKNEKQNHCTHQSVHEYNFFTGDISEYENILFESSRNQKEEEKKTKSYSLSLYQSSNYTKKSNQELIEVSQFIQKVILMRIAKSGRLTLEEVIQQIKLDDYINVCEKEIPFIDKKKLKLLFFLLLKRNFIKKVKSYNEHVCEFSKKSQITSKREGTVGGDTHNLNLNQKKFDTYSNFVGIMEEETKKHKETENTSENLTNFVQSKEKNQPYYAKQDSLEKEREQEMESDEIIFLKSVKENKLLEDRLSMKKNTKENIAENKGTARNKRGRTAELEQEPTKENKRRRGRESKKTTNKNQLEAEENPNKRKRIHISNEENHSEKENQCIKEGSYNEINHRIIPINDILQESRQGENDLISFKDTMNNNIGINIINKNDEKFTHFQINAEVLSFVFLKQECFNFIIQYYRFNEVIKCIFFFLLQKIYFQFPSDNNSTVNYQVSFCSFEHIENYVLSHFKRKQMEINQHAILQNLNVLTKNPDEFVIIRNDQIVSYAIDFTKVKEFYKKKLIARIVEKMIDHEGLRIWNYLISEENEKYTDESIGDQVLIPINEVRKKLYNLLHLGLIKSHEGSNNPSNKFYMKGSILFFANMMNTIDEIKNKLFFIARKLYMRKFFENNKINLAYNKTTMFGNELEQEKNERELEKKNQYANNYILENNCDSLSHIEYALDYLEISLINLDKYLLFYTST